MNKKTKELKERYLLIEKFSSQGDNGEKILKILTDQFFMIHPLYGYQN
jgi:hypothetical protein